MAMLILESSHKQQGSLEQEVAMSSSIHIFPFPHREWTQKKTDAASTESSRRQGQSSGQSMMYPWSIGTTRAAQEHPVVRRAESCPPEVYIG